VINTDKLIEELSLNMRAALSKGEMTLAKSINDKINQLIKYTTNIPE